MGDTAVTASWSSFAHGVSSNGSRRSAYGCEGSCGDLKGDLVDSKALAVAFERFGHNLIPRSVD